MVYWLILVVYGIGSGEFTVTTQAMHVGNYSDLKACMAAAKDSQSMRRQGFAGQRIFGQLAIQLSLRSSLRRQIATSVETDAVSARRPVAGGPQWSASPPREAMAKRWDHMRLGFAVQLGTVRFLGTFVDDLATVPAGVVGDIARQLSIGNPDCIT